MIHKKITLGSSPKVDKLRQALSAVPDNADLRLNSVTHMYEVHWMEPENPADQATLDYLYAQRLAHA